MSAPSADEVVEGFKESLSDLQINNRYEISGLTIIAKEQIEHAQAISKTLETHVRTVRMPYAAIREVMHRQTIPL